MQKNKIVSVIFFLSTIINLNIKIIAMEDNSITEEDSIKLSIVKEKFIINALDGEYGSEQYSICGAIDGEGNYCLTWIDTRSSFNEIYAQFYNSAGEKLGQNIRVSGEKNTTNSSPVIAAAKNGGYIIAWVNNYRRIFAQRYLKSGIKIGANILVSSLWENNVFDPAAYINTDGSSLIKWNSIVNGQNLIYLKQIEQNGDTFHLQIIENDSSPFITNDEGRNQIAADGFGGFYIIWRSGFSNNSTKIFFQRIDSTGQKIGEKIIVNTDSSNQKFSAIAASNDGHIMVTWEKNKPNSNGSEVAARIYNPGSGFEDEFILFSTPYTNLHNGVSTDAAGAFFVYWFVEGSPWIQKIESNGNKIGQPIKMKFDSTYDGYIQSGIITNFINDKFYVAVDFTNKNERDILLKKYNINLTSFPSVKVNDDIGSSDQKRSLVKFNNRGESIVLWADQKNGNYDLYAQIFDTDFKAAGDNIQINNDYEYWSLFDKKIASLSDGSFIILYSGAEPSYPGTNVYIQKVSPSGEKLRDAVVKLSTSYKSYTLALNINPDDEILICMYDNEIGASIKKYDKDLTPLTVEKKFMQPTSRKFYYNYAVSIDTGFNIFVIWQEFDLENNRLDNKIKGSFFNGNGELKKGSFIIDSTNNYLSTFKCKNDDENYAVILNEDNTIKIKRRYVHDKEFKLESSFAVISYLPTYFNIIEFDNQKLFITYNSPYEVKTVYFNDNVRKIERGNLHNYVDIFSRSNEFNGINSVDIFNDKLFFTYESDNNENTGSDIWGKIWEVEDVNFDNEYFYPLVNSDVLYPNYPNPFNPVTTITYELLAYHRVKLSVYDILGREVKVLVDDFQEKGIHEITFNASGLASGIYFYMLDAFDVSIKKMVLVK